MVALADAISDYDRPIAFEHVLEHAYEEYGYNVDPNDDDAFGTHKDRLDKLATYDNSVWYHVVGRIPRADIWVDMALDHVGADDVTSETLNTVQEACVEIGENRSNQYFEATKQELQNRACPDIDASEYDSRDELVADVAEAIAKEAVTILPQRQESMRQGGQSSAGNANEELASQVLQSHGLELGEGDSDCDFREKTNNDSDLIVYDADGDKRFVEVKSTAARERVGRAVGKNDQYWVLFGFFNDYSEVRNGILFENNQTPAWSDTTNVAYSPPETVAGVKAEDTKKEDGESAYRLRNSEGKLYLRSNTIFARDMAALNSTGELTDVSPGHEEQFL